LKILELRAQSIRCFDDIGVLALSEKCNVFIGSNNSGKSTLLRIPLSFQGFDFQYQDFRQNGLPCVIAVKCLFDSQADRLTNLQVHGADAPGFYLILERDHSGTGCSITGHNPIIDRMVGDINLAASRPNHIFVPFLAKRRAVEPSYAIDTVAQSLINGKVGNIVSRIDLLAPSGHPLNKLFAEALEEIIGIQITTVAHQGGKQAGFYLNTDNFIAIENMGDGITEMVAMIVELVLERGKVFIIEEPEANLHPKSLKALLGLIKKSSEHNQFLISTHSNIVLRELSGIDGAKIFNVSRTSDEIGAPSVVEEVPATPEARVSVLRDLGYEFGDFDLHDAWLFLEESSAESIFRDILIPMFAPELAGKLRTFSAGGVTNLEPRLKDFQNLFVFLHLAPAYQGKVWVRADGDEAGLSVIEGLKAKFDHLTDATCAVFSEDNFETYYPAQFQDTANAALALGDKKEKGTAKRVLLKEVLEWTKANENIAREEWAKSAGEPIKLLEEIVERL
jgi:hypothetical protein